MVITVAVTWNFIYNCLFEFWGGARPCADAALRGGWRTPSAADLVVYLIPLIAWWMGISCWRRSGWTWR